MPKYTIRQNRIKSGCLAGFDLNDSMEIVFNDDAMYHGIFLRGIDGGESEAGWGRFSFRAECSENLMYYVHAVALDHKVILGHNGGEDLDLDVFLTDESIEVPDKVALIKRLGGRQFAGCQDCLLYELSGRYLYIAIEARGSGTLVISDMKADTEGDNFMATYPEVYRERGSFFHRFISVFSSIYNDFDEDIDNLPKLLDLDTCPEELLIIYGGWMGIDLKGGFLDTDVLRDLVKEAYSLNRMKGTKRAMERILEIILREKAIVIEHNQIKDQVEEGVDVPEGFKAKGIYDVTILVKKHLSEELRHQIFFILDQFKPVRTRISITQLDEAPITDSNTYLDVNFRLPEERGALLDDDFTLDGTIVLQ
ncbi:MAG: phage tail protein [Lachnospiraceae bacterium]|nr:phage tail protein [Lachnospiraceae bacterium]